MNKYTLFLFLFSLIMIVSCTQDSNQLTQQTPNIETRNSLGDKIGELNNVGTYIVTANENDLASTWNLFMRLSAEDGVDPNSIQIETQADGTIVLRGDLGKGGVATVALVDDGTGDVYERGDGKSCSCSGCTTTGPNSVDHCVPKWTEDGKCYCTECPAPLANCVKTVTEGGPSSGDVLTP